MQTLLKLAGYWPGPIDGVWTPELSAALMAMQTELGVPATGAVDALDAERRARAPRRGAGRGVDDDHDVDHDDRARGLDDDVDDHRVGRPTPPIGGGSPQHLRESTAGFKKGVQVGSGVLRSATIRSTCTSNAA